MCKISVLNLYQRVVKVRDFFVLNVLVKDVCVVDV